MQGEIGRSLNLRNCFEELVRFTLCSHALDLQLSREFCSTLLKDDPQHSNEAQQHSDLLEGVPPYPLYKRLASALLKCMNSEAFCWTCNDLLMIHDTSSIKQKQNEWHKLIVDKGSEIVNILNRVDFELHVQEPFFSQLKDGLKTIEGRCAGVKFGSIESGNLILSNKSVLLEVQGTRWYPTFSDMLEVEDIAKVLPGVENVEEGVKVYRRFYSEEKEQENGVLAIIVSKISLQPYIPMTSLFSGLSYDGVQGLLGVMHTIGTIPNALPPPASTLLTSFNLPYDPNVKASSLTHGARALAKHTHRSSNRHWASLEGSDANKNRIAVDVIDHLMAHCCWLNVHIVPPHGAVFEIRDADGYGARWTEDGKKFIGFLEPYMEDGHSKGWKH
ncbi:hypothetical protein L6164_023886 [Bauhinia variegata]|uniref:Uncharacterized protein n=1 Tax=Bauhinia variegata TaxID=167791 RepID=A0ACB9MLV9_BAUVA|nr:hypothetical protein L6164_023886 [Bauhinia variegata]